MTDTEFNRTMASATDHLQIFNYALVRMARAIGEALDRIERMTQTIVPDTHAK